SEIQNLNPGFRDHDITRLQIAMNDLLAVRLRQCSRDLRGIQERRLPWKRSAFEPGCYGLALHQFHYQVIRPHIVERADVGMVERRNRARLALETGAELFVSRLDGDGAPYSRVYRPKDFPHAAVAELAFDTVGP